MHSWNWQNGTVQSTIWGWHLPGRYGRRFMLAVNCFVILMTTTGTGLSSMSAQTVSKRDCKFYFSKAQESSTLENGIKFFLENSPLHHQWFILSSGVHHKKKTCEAGIVVQKVRDILSRAEGFLYPKELLVSRVVQRKRKVKQPKGNGGWGDFRDHSLCLKMSQSENVTLAP